jgi:NAD(P)-dependent dehydrogenase (short-subunit alcohol dehydrogenase family)
MTMFTNKIAIVTGASSGIGRETAVSLARQGASVAAVGREAAALESVIADCTHAGARAIAVVADLTADDAPQTIVDKTIEHFGALDILVNAAGASSRRDRPTRPTMRCGIG